MGQVTGLGGAFLRVKDPGALYAWYERHFGLKRTDYGAFSFAPHTVTSDTLLVFFPPETKNFGPGPQQVMLNLRVDDLDGLVESLTAAGVELDPKRDNSEYGKFAWAIDPEGNRIELYEPAPESNDPA